MSGHGGQRIRLEIAAGIDSVVVRLVFVTFQTNAQMSQR